MDEDTRKELASIIDRPLYKDGEYSKVFSYDVISLEDDRYRLIELIKSFAPNEVEHLKDMRGIFSEKNRLRDVDSIRSARDRMRRIVLRLLQ